MLFFLTEDSFAYRICGQSIAISSMGNKITRRRPAIDERYTRPQGLYPHRDVDQRKLRRLILDAKLAPCFPGGEEPASDLEECPICFLHYPSLNRSKCCSKGICTECFLQMKSPHAARPTQCPFCKTPNYAVEYRGAKTLEEKGVEQAEEQKVIEAKIRMRQQELQDDEAREHRREDDIREGRITPRSPQIQPDGSILIDTVPTYGRDRGTWRTNWGNSGVASQQVMPLSDYEKWKQLLQEPGYWCDHHWLRKPSGPSLEAGSSNLTSCGLHCAPDCAKCLMTFHKRRGYDILNVSTPQSGCLKEDRILPSAGRWRSTWGNFNSPLSRSFPLPSRVPEYHCRQIRIFEPKVLDRSLFDPLTGCGSGQFTCKLELEEKAQVSCAPISAALFESSDSAVDPDSLWVRQRFEAGDATEAQQQVLAPLASNPPIRDRSNTGFPTPQPPPGALRQPSGPPAFSRHRDDEFDLDLEDIMVMEAIWLSIQEQGARHRFSDADPPQLAPSQLTSLMSAYGVGPDTDGELATLPPPPPPPPPPASEARDLSSGRRGSVTGGLAGAIAALAERQATAGDVAPASQQTIMSILAPEREVDVRTEEESGLIPTETSNPQVAVAENTENISCSESPERCNPPNGLNKYVMPAPGDNEGELSTSVDEVGVESGREEETGNMTRASEGLANWVSSTQQEYGRGSKNKWSGDQSSEQVEVGTSFSSSIPSASELPWEAPESPPDAGNGESSCGVEIGKVMLPESFEEQMMLAMALSLAEAQSRVRQGDTSGSQFHLHANEAQ